MVNYPKEEFDACFKPTLKKLVLIESNLDKIYDTNISSVNFDKLVSYLALLKSLNVELKMQVLDLVKRNPLYANFAVSIMDSNFTPTIKNLISRINTFIDSHKNNAPHDEKMDFILAKCPLCQNSFSTDLKEKFKDSSLITCEICGQEWHKNMFQFE
jgi:ribosomal protein S27E